MVRALRGLPLVVAGVAALFAAGSVGGASPKPRVKVTVGDVAALAMNGAVVTYGVHPDSGCAKVFVWNVESGSGARVSGPNTCVAYGTSTGAGIAEVASAGNRTAWILNSGGNTEASDDLYAATLPKPKERQVATATRVGDTQGALGGDWIGNLAGDGAVLMAEFWNTNGNGAVVRDGVRLLTPSGLSKPFGGTAPIDELSLDGARVAVRRGTKVGIYSTAGRLTGSLALAPGESILRVVLSGQQLVVRHLQDLAIYDVATGRRLRIFATTGSPRSLDAANGIAVFSRLGDVYVASLATGRTRLLAHTNAEISGLAIGRAGVVFASGNRITYYPLAQVLAAPHR